jgi:hypothetical protein
MEIERGVKIEIAGDWEGGLSNWESGLSSGPRSVEQLPEYTIDELRQGLGKTSDVIERAFRGQPQVVTADEDANLVISGTA